MSIEIIGLPDRAAPLAGLGRQFGRCCGSNRGGRDHQIRGVAQLGDQFAHPPGRFRAPLVEWPLMIVGLWPTSRISHAALPTASRDGSRPEVPSASMHCIIHVGTEKTATTTLQRLFDRKRPALAAERVAYTRSAGVGNNWRLAVAAYDNDRVDDRSVDAGVDGPESRRVFRAQLLAALTEEVTTARAGHDVDTLLLSSEHFHSRLTRESEIRRLAEMLADLGVTRTTVLVYLRDPCRWPPPCTRRWSNTDRPAGRRRHRSPAPTITCCVITGPASSAGRRSSALSRLGCSRRGAGRPLNRARLRRRHRLGSPVESAGVTID